MKNNIKKFYMIVLFKFFIIKIAKIKKMTKISLIKK